MKSLKFFKMNRILKLIKTTVQFSSVISMTSYSCMLLNKFMSDQISLEIKQQYNIYIFIWYNLNGYCVYLSLSTHTCTVGLSLACASTCNLLLMRNSELSTGIEVEDHNGNVIGKSKVAAKKVKKKTLHQLIKKC